MKRKSTRRHGDFYLPTRHVIGVREPDPDHPWLDVLEEYPQYADVPGITTFLWDNGAINALLYYSEETHLVAYLHCYTGQPILGDIYVKRDFRRQGIATKLVQEAQKRWKATPDRETWSSTEEGQLLMKGLLQKKILEG